MRPLVFLLVGGGAIAAATALLFLLVPLLIRSALSLFGLGATVLLPGAGVLVWRWRSLGSQGFFMAHWRHVLGGLLLYVGGLGLAALARPDGLGTWGVAWSEASFGGLLGQAILGEPGLPALLGESSTGQVGASGLLRSLAMLLAGVALVIPRSLRLTGNILLHLWGFVVSLRLPQRIAVLARFALTQSRSALSTRISAYRTSRTAGPAVAAGLPALPGESSTVAGRDPYYDAEASPEEATPFGGPAPFGEGGETAAQQVAAEAGIQSTLLPIVDEGQDTPSPPHWNLWEQPNLALLETASEPEAIDQTQRARQIEDALASYGVEGTVVQIHVGPAVTQFGVEPGWDRKYREIRERDSSGRSKLDKDGNPKVRQEEVSRTRVKVERISGLSNNLAMALAAPSVRIEAPVPGQKIVGIEVPNQTPSLVALRSVIETPPFQRLQSRSKLALAMGKGVSGDPVVADLSKMPHLLIAGATGSGKSVCINSIICCLLMHASPDDVRFLMVDPKRVELVPYNPIPHLLAPVIVDAEKVVGTLHWLTQEMEGRYRKFAAVGVRNIEGYNHSPKVHGQLPYWILIIDELADLMMVAPYEVERGICRLAQLARATGIHLVVATQRPSVDVVTGLIKANFPTRVS
ncbi:MAG TPA: DNA translocase FtsK, partial [Dehalococcoidia bacterium]|nr:DNA translocase FtsK [Dehalococcoidia bacterium]